MLRAKTVSVACFPDLPTRPVRKALTASVGQAFWHRDVRAVSRRGVCGVAWVGSTSVDRYYLKLSNSVHTYLSSVGGVAEDVLR